MLHDSVAKVSALLERGNASKNVALLQDAIRQVPDYFYVKDRKSRFVATNVAVARINGRNTPEEMLGLTDFDLVDQDRATRLFDDEQRIMENGGRLPDKVERINDADGSERWYLTTKEAVRDRTGNVTGLVGISRDITENFRMESDLQETRDRLMFIMDEMSDGIALFDTKHRLVFCNERYHSFFSLTRDVRVPGASMESILRAAVTRREQPGIPEAEVDAFVASVHETLQTGGDEEISLFDGRWARARTRVVEGMGAVSVVSDISKRKAAENELQLANERLRRLSVTDALTELPNRRALDDFATRELARGRRQGQPTSIILADIDHFKSFNDLFGHQAGDACLKRVAKILSRCTGRGNDIVARYGGEEFCAVLPDTDRAGAKHVADAMREAVEAAAIEHRGSDRGVVTISVGVTTITRYDMFSTPAGMFTTADDALYCAKGNGRNRVCEAAEPLAEGEALRA